MSKRDKKRERRVQIILTFFIVFIMSSSIIGFLWGGDDEEQVKYGAHSFTRTGNRWMINVNEQQVIFDFFPTGVEDINVSSIIIQRLKNTREIDTTYDQNDSNVEAIAAAIFSLNQILGNQMIYVRSGFTENSTYNIPIITCMDSTNVVPVIYFKTSNVTRISLENDCIIAEARFVSDFARIKDRLLYGMLGIIDG